MKDAYWFHHDSNAKDDPKCSMLIEQLGLEGYGIYWVLVETLREQTEYKYPLSMIPIIARKYNTTAEKVRVVVGNYGLFTLTEDEFFLSESLCRRMESWDLKRLSASNAGKKSGAIRALLSCTPKEEKSHLPQLYVIRCFNNQEEFIKVGSTSGTISRRYSGHLPYSYEVVYQVFDKENYMELEEEIRKRFSHSKYNPAITFGGNNECYLVDEAKNIVDFIKNERRMNVGSTNKRREEKRRDINISPFEQAFDDFREMRKKLKKPMTDRAEKTIRKKIDQLASTDEEKIAILEQSIVSCWLGVFPLRQQFNSQPQQTELGKEFWRGAL